MGIEYRVLLPHPSPQEWDTVLRAIPYFSQYNQEYHLYEFRASTRQNLPDMPDVVLGVEATGLYICDYGNKEFFQTLLTRVRDTITAQGQPFALEDYE